MRKSVSLLGKFKIKPPIAKQIDNSLYVLLYQIKTEQANKKALTQCLFVNQYIIFCKVAKQLPFRFVNRS